MLVAVRGCALVLSCVLAFACGARSGLEDLPPQTPNTSDGGVDAGDGWTETRPGDGGLDAGDPTPTDAGPPDGGSDPIDGGDGTTRRCIELVPGAPPTEISIAWREVAGAADILVLMDATGSMRYKLEVLQRRFRDTLRPAIERTSDDLRVGFATFQDFDYSRWLPMDPLRPIVTEEHYVFHMGVPMTRDTMAIQRAVDDIVLRNTIDWPEAQNEALFQVATGAGNGSWVAPGRRCPAGHAGYPCFRPRASSVVLLFTDAPFHDGPTGRFPYPRTRDGRRVVPSHDYAQTVAALNAAGIRVAGFWSGSSRTLGQTDVRDLAIDTGAVDRFGEPIFVDLGGPAAVSQVLITQVIQRLFDVPPTDVTLDVRDLGGDDGDALAFVESIAPQEPEPEEGARWFPDHYEDVWAGTTLRWVVTLRNDVIEPGPRTLRYRLRLVMRGDDLFDLRRRTFTIVIPGADGGGC